MTVRTPARRIAIAFAALGLGLAGALAVPMSASAVDGVVDNVLDDGSPGTLRYEVENAADGDTITFGPLFDSGTHVIELTDTINIPSSITIVGPGSDVLTVQRADAGGFTQIEVSPEDADPIVVDISGLTISGIVDALPQGGDGVGFASVVPELAGLTFTDVWFSDQSAFTASAVTIQGSSGPILFENSGVINNISSVGGVGGAVTVSGGSGDVTFSNTRIDQNDAAGSGAGVSALNLGGALRFIDSGVFGNTAGTIGGAVYATDIDGGVHVTDTTFNGNTALDGGAMYVTDSAITVTDSTFEFNTATENAGGAIYAVSAIEAVSVSGTEFEGNTAEEDAGALYLGDLTDNVVVTNSLFLDNEAGSDGGAIYIPAVAPASTVSFAGTDFAGNTALAGAGGGLYVGDIPIDSTVTVFQSHFIENSVLNDGPTRGGGIFVSAHEGAVTIDSSTFASNDAFIGSSIGVNENNGTMTVLNSTFYELVGHAISQGVLDGDLFITLSTFVGVGAIEIGLNEGVGLVSNSIIESTGDPVVIDGVDDPIGAEWTLFSQAIDPDFVNDIEGNLASTDPQLGDLADNGGPTLTMLPAATSPAINRGDPAIALAPEFDQRGTGFPRIENSRVDMGAVEVFVEPVLPATGVSVNAVVPIGGALLLLVGAVAVVGTRLRRV